MESHLLQMRGLKLLELYLFFNLLTVASFTDAWIETQVAHRYPPCLSVASFTDAWIETPWRQASGSAPGRIFYRCVD